MSGQPRQPIASRSLPTSGDFIDEAELQRRLQRDYRLQFEACSALRQFVSDHQSLLVLDERSSFVIAATFARGYKTFRSSIALCADGFGEQAAMLNRSIFEDMAVAYWVQNEGEAAVDQLNRHHELVVDQYRDAVVAHDRPTEAAGIRALSAKRRGDLEREFGPHGSWFGKGGLRRILQQIEGAWPDPEMRKLLWRMYALGHRYNTLLLHHSANALNQTAVRRPDGGLAYSAATSTRNVGGALLSAYFPLSQLARLAYASEDLDVLDALIDRDLPRFSRLDPP